jgi:hypothetical protein
MGKLILMVLLVGSFYGHAEDKAKPKEAWFCLDESGKRDGDILWACGVGEAPSESLARADGLREAMNEFKTICQASVDCDANHVTVEPMRMTCTEGTKGWKCYRLIEVVMIHKGDIKKGEQTNLAKH